MDSDREEFEHIPWASLAAETRDPWVRWLGMGVGVVVAIVLGMVAVRLIRGGNEGTVVESGESAASVAAPTTTAPPAPTTEPNAPVVTTAVGVESPRLYSEAELVVSEADAMAAIPQFDTVLVVARAEWFVTDFFTVDGDTARIESVLGALPPGATDAWTQESAGAVSYVEWARAASLAATDVGRFEVVVLFRTLAGSDRAALERQPVRAVVIVVEVDDAGSVAIAELPLPAPLPPGHRVEALPAPGDDPPDAVVAAAMEVAAEAWGMESTVVGATLDQGVWRVEVVMADSGGLRWPLAVRVPVES